MLCRLTSNKQAELAAQRETEFAKTLPKTFVLTEKRDTQRAFAVAAAAARNPVQPMRPGRYMNEDGSSSQQRRGSAEANAAVVVASTKRVPPAKRSHMDGILQGIPGCGEPSVTTQQRAFEYDGEMDDMNKDKDTRFHRKRDAYSEYVEARARFSKMHSVN